MADKCIAMKVDTEFVSIPEHRLHQIADACGFAQQTFMRQDREAVALSKVNEDVFVVVGTRSQIEGLVAKNKEQQMTG